MWSPRCRIDIYYLASISVRLSTSSPSTAYLYIYREWHHCLRCPAQRLVCTPSHLFSATISYCTSFGLASPCVLGSFGTSTTLNSLASTNSPTPVIYSSSRALSYSSSQACRDYLFSTSSIIFNVLLWMFPVYQVSLRYPFHFSVLFFPFHSS